MQAAPDAEAAEAPEKAPAQSTTDGSPSTSAAQAGREMAADAPDLSSLLISPSETHDAHPDPVAAPQEPPGRTVLDIRPAAPLPPLEDDLPQALAAPEDEPIELNLEPFRETDPPTDIVEQREENTFGDLAATADESVGRPSPGADRERAPLAAPAATDTAANAEPGYDEPSFVVQARRKQRFGRLTRVILWLGSLLLLLALAAQLIALFRNQLAARMPQMAPALSGACALLGCRIELPAQIDALVIESGELQTQNADSHAYVFTGMLRNQSGTPQAWPHLELNLSDADGKPVARRVFGPREYLPRGQGAENGFAARSEQAVRLVFEVSQLQPSGYQVYLFYP
ncbi:DUF3426 domain-containing protein [Noviherbaspirillum humi]|nr:DUF3426 domain-containing protein [Noviherbaspirillum humi]